MAKGNVSKALQSATQRDKKTIAGRISKDVSRFRRRNPHTFPRGLENTGALCYRNAALQPLLHVPHFVNFILKHNQGRHWPCNSNDRNGKLPPDCERKYGTILTDMGDRAMGCVPCLLKDLIRGYWYMRTPGERYDAQGRPPRINPDDEAISRSHDLADVWYCKEAGTYAEKAEFKKNFLKGTNEDFTGDQKEELRVGELGIKVKSMRAEMKAKQDSESFLQELLERITQLQKRVSPRVFIFMVSTNLQQTIEPVQRPIPRFVHPQHQGDQRV